MIMDPYSDQIQELINSDIGRAYDENSQSNDSTYPSLSSVPSMDIDDNLLENSLDVHDQSSWLTKNHLISFDSDGIGNLFVNPTTGIPTNLSSTQLGFSNSLKLETNSSQSKNNSNVNKCKISNSLVTSNIFPSSEIVTIQSSSQNKGIQNVQIPSKIQSIVQIQQPVIINESSPKPKNKNAKSLNQNNDSNKVEKVYPKPAYSYSCLIAMALKNSKTGSLPVNEIYTFMTDNFPYFKTAPNGWKNSVRHNLSLNKSFEKVEQPVCEGSQRKRCLWAMNPAKVDKLDEELHKCTAKDPVAIRRSMANPERLPLLEKGQLKHLYDKSDGSAEDQSSSDDLDDQTPAVVTPSTKDIPPLDSGMATLDSLSELELQKGIWSELCGGAIPFLPESSQPMDQEESNQETRPGLAIVHGNYVYTTTSGGAERILAASSVVKTERCES